MTSNAYAPVEYWQEVSKNVNYICFSYHAENPMDDFLDKVMYASQNTMVTVRVMMHSQHWEHTVSVYESICQLNHVFVEPVRILDWGGPGRTVHVYTQEQLDWFIKAEQLLRASKRLILLRMRICPNVLLSMHHINLKMVVLLVELIL